MHIAAAGLVLYNFDVLVLLALGLLVDDILLLQLVSPQPGKNQKIIIYLSKKRGQKGPGATSHRSEPIFRSGTLLR